MKKKRLLLVAAITAASCVAAWFAYAVLSPSPEPGPTRENFLRLRAGMELEEVNEIMGPEAFGGRVTRGAMHWWLSDECVIDLRFGHELTISPTGNLVRSDKLTLRSGKLHDNDGIVMELRPRVKSVSEIVRQWLPWK